VTYPWAALTWNRSTQPDGWEITRDNIPIAREDGVDFFVSGTSYAFTDRLADPRKNHTWVVYPIVNGKRGLSASVVGMVKALGCMLTDSAGTNAVLILNANKTPELKEISEVHEVLASVPPVLITQALRGYQGSVSGVVADNTLTGRTAEAQGVRVNLYLVDRAIDAIIFNINWVPNADTEGVFFNVSFDFFEVGF